MKGPAACPWLKVAHAFFLFLSLLKKEHMLVFLVNKERMLVRSEGKARLGVAKAAKRQGHVASRREQGLGLNKAD